MNIPGFVRNVATLATGSVVANVITLIAIPFISRLFSPEDFGAAALFMSMVTVLSVVATLRYEHAIVLPETEEEAVDLSIISTLVIFMAVMLIAAAAVAMYLFLPGQSWVNTLGMWLLLVPIGVLLLSLGNVAVHLNTWKKGFRDIATADVSQAGITSIYRVAAGVALGAGPGGLIAGVLLGNILRLYLLSRRWAGAIRRSLQLLSRERMKNLLWKYQQFPKYSMPTGLLRSLGQNLPVFFLAFMFSPAIVGFFSMARRVMNVPVLFFGEPVRRTYLQKAAELDNQGVMLRSTIIKTTSLLAAVGLLVFLPLMVWGQEIFGFVLGEQWRAAGPYVAVLTPWFYTLLAQSTPSVAYIVRKRQDILFRVHAGSTLCILLVFLLTYIYEATILQTLIALSFVGTATNLLIILQGIHLASSSDR